MSIKNLYPDTQPSLSLDFANTKALDPRITFARASTARAYDGKTVAKAEENLLIRSQEFDNAYWAKLFTTITANSTTAPDGTSTAETINEEAVTANHLIRTDTFVFSGNQTYTASIFAKYIDAQYVILSLYDSAFQDRYASIVVDIQNGTHSITNQNGSGYTVTAFSVTSVGNSWYRISMTATIPAITGTGRFAFGFSNSATPTFLSFGFPNYAGTNRTAFIWGAQLEQRSAVTAYTPTTDQRITNYVPVLLSAANNVARFDHNPVTGESLGLLIEEQRTNLVLRSEEFDNASWVKTGIGTAAIVANQGISPDGTLSADLYRSSSSGPSVIFQTLSVSSVSHAISVYAKASGVRYFAIRHDLSGTNRNIMFDLENGTIVFTGTGNTATITPVGNGWYRCSTVATASAGTRGVAFKYSTTTISNDNDWTNAGDGFNGVFIWGAQLEAGAFPTSYIPTVASQVTRSADAASMTGANFSSWYRADEGTLYSESIAPAGIGTTSAWVFSLDNGSSSERIFGRYNASTFTTAFSIGALGAAQALLTSVAGFTNRQSVKTASTFKTDDVAASTNGASVLTDTSAYIPPNINVLRIGGSDPSLVAYLNSTIKKLAFYPRRISNAELQALTQN